MKPVTFVIHIENESCYLMRKLEPFERHYYKPNEYKLINGSFWLILSHTAGDSLQELKQILG